MAQQPDSADTLHIEDTRLRGSEAAKDAAVVHQDVVHEFIIVTYGSGLAIQSILTGFEYFRIRVENIPVDASDSDVKELFAQQGLDPSQVFISGYTKPGGEFQHVDVIFHPKIRTTMPILKSLTFRGRRISFSNVGGDQLGSSMTPDWNTLTLTWASPSFSCIATFPSHNRAQEQVRNLNGKTCNGRNVAINFFPSSDSATTPSVFVHGLHPDTTDSMIKIFLGVEHSSLIERQPIRWDDSSNNVRTSLLRQFPLLVRIEETKADRQGGQSSLKLHFPSWKEAKPAHDFFRQPREFPDYPHFTLHRPARCKYTGYISSPQYKAQLRQWRAIQNSSTHDAYLVVSPPKPNRTLTVNGKDPKAAGALKIQVERLLVGEKLGVWHPFFISHAFSPTLMEIGKATHTFIRIDEKAQLLKGFGTPERIRQATVLLQAEVTKLEKQERYIYFTGESLSYLDSQGLPRTQEELGDENVTCNVATRPATITITGEAAAPVPVDALIEDKSPSLKPLNSSEQCPVCLDNATHAVKLDCQHVYCEECFKHYMSAAHTLQFPLVCLKEKSCGNPIPLPTIRKFLLSQTYKALLEAALDAYIAARPREFKFCPTPDCRQVYRKATDGQGQTVVCPSCFAETCSSCHKEGHDGMPCEEKIFASDPAAQEQATEQLANREGYKKCPSCQVWVEKTWGCNHMTCRLCRAHFCWVCLQSFDAAVIHRHMNEAHGGIHGVQMRNENAIMRTNGIAGGLGEYDPVRAPMDRRERQVPQGRGCVIC